MGDIHIPPGLIEAEAAKMQQAQPKKGKGLHPAWWAGLIGANVADAITTADAVNDGRGREANPLLRGISDNAAILGLAKAGIGAGEGLLLNHLHKKNPKGAKIGAAILTAVPALLALHNARVGK